MELEENFENLMVTGFVKPSSIEIYHYTSLVHKITMFGQIIRTNFSMLSRPVSSVFSNPALRLVNPVLTRGFKVRTAVKKFCSDCYVC